MAFFDFAQRHTFDRPTPPYTAGPFRIIHHTTEGNRATDAFDAYIASGMNFPHFTVDRTTIFQHVDTDLSSRAVGHSGDPETNRLSAIQIEVVGRAKLPKDLATLQNVVRLCRAIEAEHGIPGVWPSGFPARSPEEANAPGFRNVENWVNLGGHYGHCHVPENDHWDPGYSPPEVHLIMQEITVVVNGSVLPLAGAYLGEDGHVHGWLRPIATAMQAVPGNVGETTVDLTRDGVTQTLDADVGDGYAFVRLVDLTAFSGVEVQFDDSARTLTLTV